MRIKGRLLVLAGAALLLLLRSTSALAASYVVLQDSDENSLVRVSMDGKSVTTIARGIRGIALAIDAHGDYIVASKSVLWRVTPRGEVTEIVKAPDNSTWASVAVDHAGNLLVADGAQPALWRISPDGKTLRKILFGGATFAPGNIRRASVFAGPGDDLTLLIQSNRWSVAGPQLFTISPDDAVREIPVVGDPVVYPTSLISDGSADFLFVGEYPETAYNGTQVPVMRLTRDGRLSRFTSIPAGSGQIRMIRNAETGELVVCETYPGRLLVVDRDGTTVKTLVSLPHITYPVALVEDSNR